jgi:hypothetical protein
MSNVADICDGLSNTTFVVKTTRQLKVGLNDELRRTWKETVVSYCTLPQYSAGLTRKLQIHIVYVAGVRVWNAATSWPVVHLMDDIWCVEPQWNGIDGETRTTRRKTCPSTTLTTTNFTWTDPVANPGLQDEKSRLTAWAMTRLKLRTL